LLRIGNTMYTSGLAFAGRDLVDKWCSEHNGAWFDGGLAVPFVWGMGEPNLLNMLERYK
jgi:hypothetical protein